MTNKKFLTLICARSGSKGIKDKNIQKFGKFNLLEQAILQGKKITANSTYVSTDSKKYRLIALKKGAKVPFLRPKKLSKDKTPEWDVWLDFAKKLKIKQGYNIIVLPTTSPLRNLKDIKSGIKLFNKGLYDVVVALTESSRNPYYNMLEKNKKNYKLPKSQKRNFFRRQDAPQVYDVTTFFYIFNINFLKQKKNLFDGKIGAIIIPKARSIDIDTKLDLLFARYLKKLPISRI
tara:strand:- start:130 stop:828 length:699 start_codon:yes stop_codon:yes gene_type:complete